MSDSSVAGFDADAIVVGAGLAGLVAACELVDRGLRVLIVDQENSANLGGQAFWSFGGLFFVDSPEQRRLGIRDSHELALQDWLGTAASTVPRTTGHANGRTPMSISPPGRSAVGCVRAGSSSSRWWAGPSAAGMAHRGTAIRCPASTSPGVPGPRWSRFSLGSCGTAHRCAFAHRHQVDELIVEGEAVTGVRGAVLEPTAAPSGRRVVTESGGAVRISCQAVIVTSGGIGANHDLVRETGRAHGPRPRATAQRGARPCRRPDDRHHRAGRRAGDQPRPDVALHRGHHQLRPDLADARHPDHPGPVVAVAGRQRQAAAGAAVSRASTRWARWSTSPSRASTTPGSC